MNDDEMVMTLMVMMTDIMIIKANKSIKNDDHDDNFN